MLAQTLLAAIATLPLFASTALASDCARTYTVTDGDICDSISAANNASTYQLAAINSQINNDCSNLVSNEVICLGTVGEDCATTYVVKTQDTCDDIAGAFGINTTMLWTNNPNIDSECGNIYVGEVLCVAESALVPPVPSSGLVATAIPSTAVNPTSTVAVVPSSTFSSVETTPTSDDNDDDDSEDDDDEDLPWCDEL
ncbi:hypothetical protein M0805_008532 [Coniferiporia weirii]|nr:hypothetical protein M0805_008532 [Coniferiporia weirii]